MKIDDPVVVWNSLSSGKHNEHFAGFDLSGNIQTWQDGKTSWSGTIKSTWKNYELKKSTTFNFSEYIQ